VGCEVVGSGTVSMLVESITWSWLIEQEAERDGTDEGGLAGKVQSVSYCGEKAGEAAKTITSRRWGGHTSACTSAMPDRARYAGDGRS
jgi:hypothetical protein